MADKIEIMVDKLNTALGQNDIAAFMRILRQIVEAEGGIDVVAKRGTLSADQLTHFLSEENRPKFSHVKVVLRALNMHFTLVEADFNE